MGLQIDRDHFDDTDYARFTERLQENLAALQELLSRPGFGEGPPTVGAELELFIIDRCGRAFPINRALLAKSFDSHLQLELNRFNLEYNSSAVPLAGKPFSALAAEVAPVVAQRDALGKVNLRLQRVADYVAVRPDPRAILGRLSVLIPDSAYLTRFEIRGDTVIIGGLAENAAGLMEIVGAQAEFREVRAPAAITRDRSSGRESFTMEFKLADGGDSK